MKTINAAQVTRWINTLSRAEAALKAAEDIPGIAFSQWNKFWEAKADTSGVRRELMEASIGPIAIEVEAA